MSTVLIQVEFYEVLYNTFAGAPAITNFCLGVQGALNVSVLCNTAILIPEGNLLLEGIQVQVQKPVNVYGSAVMNVNNALSPYFLAHGSPRVTVVSEYYHPDSSVIGLSVIWLLIFCMLVALVFNVHFPMFAHNKR